MSIARMWAAQSPSATSEVVVARGVRLRYPNAEVLRQIDLGVPAGEALLLVGRNGTGKSALLRILAGLERPSGGVVQIKGCDPFGEAHRVRRQVGYVAQEPRFDPELSVREILTFAARPVGVSVGEGAAVVDSMLQLVDLFDLRNRPAAQLSRGERQRLAIAHALVPDPDVLLLDEPLPLLDEATQSALIEVLFELKAMGKTLLVATHSPWLLLDWADTLAVLADGQLKVGQVADFRSAEAGTSIVRIGVLGDADAAVARLRARGLTFDVERSPEPNPEGITFLRSELADQPEVVAELVRTLVADGVAVVEVGRELPALAGIA